MSTFKNNTWIDRDGCEWLVTQTEESQELRYGELVAITHHHSWSFEEGEVTQTIESWNPEPVLTRDAIGTQFQTILDEMRLEQL